MTEKSKQAPVGIDLGTTFSAVAYLDGSGRPETIRNSEGDLTTPSAVFFDHQRPIVGVEAVEAGLLEPDRLAQYAKRDVGEDYYEKQIRGKHLPAEVIQALVLRKLKADAELSLGEISEAVITVPAFFNEPCRKATQDAGRLAGLNVLDIINEPTAAAITYGVHQGFLGADGASEKTETVLVYDLGGGTFDVTVMEISDGNFNTIATAGDVYLGGIDWDGRIVDFIAESFEAEHGSDPRKDPQAIQELLRKANQAKHALTQREAVTIAFAHDGKRLRTELTQKEFIRRCEDLVERTLMTVQLVLDDAETGWSKLTRLILVGGSTRMPMIREELKRLSGMELDRSLSPDEAVSHGAALYAGMLMAGKNDKSGISVSNVNSHDLGVLAVDPQSGKPRRQVMIPRNSRLPARKMVRFRTHTDNQANVKIEIVEGGDDRGRNATKIGKCVVDDIPRGTPKGSNVDVCFDYTADGRLVVHASLPEIDRKITMTLNRAAGLSDEEIDHWSSRLDDGLSDAMLADLPGSEDAVVATSDAEVASGETLDLPGDDPAAIVEGSGNSAARSGSPAKGKADPVVSESGKDESPDFSSLKTPEPAKPFVETRPQEKSTSPVKSTSAAKPGVEINSAAQATPKSNAAAVLNAPAAKPAVSKSDVSKAESKGTQKSKSVAAPAAKASDSAEGINIQIGDGTARPSAKMTAEDVLFVPSDVESPHRSVADKPLLDLDPKDSSPSVKADPNDFAMLASLGGAPASASDSGEVPLIMTESSSAPAIDVSGGSNPVRDKKTKGLFGRKKK